MKEYKVGEVFEHGNASLEVVAGSWLGCEDCYFNNSDVGDCPPCLSEEREDEEHVVYVNNILS